MLDDGAVTRAAEMVLGRAWGQPKDFAPPTPNPDCSREEAAAPIADRAADAGMTIRGPSFTAKERDLIRRELCRHFGQDPRIADGIFLRS